jgi:hypothetical protein
VVLPIILVVLVIIAVAVMYWYITLPIIIAIILLWKYSTRNSNKKEESEQSRRSQSSSYQSYSQSDYSSYNSNYNSNSNDYYKKTTQDDSYQKSKSKRKSRRKSKASEAKAKRVNSRLEKYKITPEEAKIIFGRTWRAKLGKQEWEFYYVVRYIEIDVEFDYNNRARKKFGELYSKVLQIIQIVMEENADMREEEGRQRKKYSGYSYDDFNWDDDDYDYKNYQGDDSDIDDKDIAKAFDTFGLTRESTKEQIKTEYRKLTLKFHPDKNKSKDSTVKMTEINKAYEIIMGVIP